MIVQPILYDFKRGLLRLSTLMLFALFFALGIGLGYITYTTMTESPPGIGELVLTVKADLERGEIWVNALSFAPPDIQVSTELYYKILCFNHTELISQYHTDVINILELAEKHGQVIYEGRDRFMGLLNYRRELGKLNLTLKDYEYRGMLLDLQCLLKYEVATPFMRIQSYSSPQIAVKESGGIVIHGVVAHPQYLVAVFLDSGSIAILPSGGAGVTQVSSGQVAVRFSPILKEGGEVLLVGAINMPLLEDLAVDIYVKPRNDSAEIKMPTLTPYSGDPVAEGFTKIATVGNGVFMARFNLADLGYSSNISSTLDLLFKMKSSSYENMLLAKTSLMTERSQDLERATLFAFITSLGAYGFLFPIVILYLPYVYIAKPRGQGALEFLVARPMTRTDLYFTRYIAGSLVVAITSYLFVYSTYLVIEFLFNVKIEPKVVFMLFAGTVLSAIAFYSLCYFIASAMKGASYIIASIVAYLFFMVIINIIVSITAVHTVGFGEYIKLEYLSRYFNPFGAFYFFAYYAQKHYGVGPVEPDVLEQIIRPHLVATSIALWITIPLILGWLLFRKANLSG